MAVLCLGREAKFAKDLIPVKVIEQFKVPESSSVSNTIEHYFVHEESTSASKAQLSAAVTITILCLVSKIF